MADASGRVVGVDFDNTIVGYDALFHRVAVEQGVVPSTVPPTKQAVRDYLRAIGNEGVWTLMQGEVYGSRMGEAEKYAGVDAFFRACRARGVRVVVISHKTRHPYAGERYDLHAAARRWLEQEGFFDPAGIGLSPEEAFFELSKVEKLRRIALEGCTHFVDDLPELLAEPHFPEGVERILFDPGGAHEDDARWTRVRSWTAITRRLLGSGGE